MKLVHLRGSGGDGTEPLCPDRVSCPNLFVTDRKSFVIQGYVTAEVSRAAGLAVVEIPLAMLPEAAVQPRSNLRLTERGTVLVRGVKVTDAAALATIQLPQGEDAVELSMDDMPTLAGVS